MQVNEFVEKWQWTSYPCWLWVGACRYTQAQLYKAVVQHVLSKGEHNPKGASLDVVSRGVEQGFHPNWVRLQAKEASKTINVEDTRSVLQDLAHKAAQPGWRVVTVEDPLNINATNALLKSLEEPSPQTLWIICVNYLGGALPTLRSRCQVVHLPIIADEGISPLAWGDKTWDETFKAWGKGDLINAWVKNANTDADLADIKALWGKEYDPWFVLDVFKRKTYEYVINMPHKEKTENWWKLSRFLKQAESAYLDPAHTWLQGVLIWHGLIDFS